MRLNRKVLAVAVLSLSALAFAQFQFYGSQGGPAFRTLAEGTQSEATQFRTEVLNSEGDLQRWWTKIGGNPAVTAPKGVQWGKEMLVAINLGQRPTLGYKVYVETIAKRLGQLAVTVVELKPAPGAMVGQAITSPWVIIRMDRQSEPLVFQRKEIVSRVIGGSKPAPCGCTCGCPYCAKGHDHNEPYGPSGYGGIGR